MILVLNGPFEAKSVYAILASNGPYEANLIQKRLTGEDTRNSAPSIFAHPVQNPPWGPFKGPKIAVGCRLKELVKNGGSQGGGG